MLDPTDAILSRYDVGDQTTAGDVTAGHAGEQPGEIASPILPRQFEPNDLSIAVGASQAVRVAGEPEYWHVKLAPTATGALLVYTGTGAGGPPIRVYPSEAVKVPGRGTDLFIVNNGPIIAVVTVVASRGFDVRLGSGG